MDRRPGAPWIASLALVACACQQTPVAVTRLEAVSPPVVAAGQARFVVLEGAFSPRVSWATGEEPALDRSFEVRVGGLPCQPVWLASAGRLVARLPDGLGEGCHAVEAIGPDGSRAELAEGLCARAVVDLRTLLAAAFLLEGRLALLDVSLRESGSSRELADSVLGGLGDVPDSGQAYDLQAGFALSADAGRVAYLRQVPSGEAPPALPYRRELWVAGLGEGAGAPVRLASRPQDEGLSEGRVVAQSLSGLRFAPSGRFLLAIEDHRRLLRFVLPVEGEEPPLAEVLAEAPAAPEASLHVPDVDLAERFVLYTLHQAAAGERAESAELHLVRLEDGRDERLLTGEGEAVLDGPGVFDPTGDRVLFVSSRLGLWLPSPFLYLVPASGWYTVELAGGRVVGQAHPEAASLAGFVTGRPELSPDGRHVASTGMIADLTGSGLDLVVLDRDTGALQRLGQDGMTDSADVSPARFCMPADVEEAPDGSGLVCPADGAHVACCDAEGCCGPALPALDQDPAHCPTYENLAAFGPDSRLLLSASVPIRLECSPELRWTLQALDANLLLGSFESTVATWFFGRVDTSAYGPSFMPLAARPYQVLGGP